jgi:hypothetical protein
LVRKIDRLSPILTDSKIPALTPGRLGTQSTLDKRVNELNHSGRKPQLEQARAAHRVKGPLDIQEYRSCRRCQEGEARSRYD